jgi:hypothetical protein
LRDTDLVNAIRRLKVETGSLACMGCGHAHNCGVSGCAIMREAAARIANQRTHIAALQQEIEKLRGQNRQLMLERNYVISIIADIRKDGKTWMCQYCAHCKGIVSGMADCDSKMPCVMPYGQFELKRPEPPKEER